MINWTEETKVEFRLLHMECCGTLLCWVNPRFPSHCPECGKFCYPAVRGWVTFKDDDARLKYRKGGSNVNTKP